MDGKLVNAFMN
jgi:DNA polymerase kappa